MPNDSVLLLIVQRPLLDFVIRVLADDCLVDEDKNDEADDSCETKQNDNQSLLPLLFLLLLVVFDGFALSNGSSSFLLSQICLDLKLKGAAPLLVELLVCLFARGASGESARNANERNRDILRRFRAQLELHLLRWKTVALSK